MINLLIKTIININSRAVLFQFFAVLVISFSTLQVSFAHHVQAAEFLSVAVFRLSEHISWPNSKNIKKYHIHIIDDKPNVELELTRISAIRQLHNRPVVISRSSNGNGVIPPNTQVIFLANHNSQLLPDILKKIKDLPILVISYDIKDQRIVMINFKTNDADKTRIRFEINKANLINRGLSIDPDIILLGGSEIDVAHLYRDSQSQLSEKERQVKAIENKISQINKEKGLMESLLVKLTQTVEQQKSTVIQQNKNYLELKQETKKQEEKIRKQINELQEREKHLNKQRIEIDKRSTILNQQQNKIDSLAITISSQDKVIKDQTKTLAKSSVTIENQRNYLYLLSILITLALLSAITAYFFYRKNQHINQELLKALKESRENANQIQIVNEQLQSFSYTVSHDLRAPLRSIAGFSQILNEDYAETLDGDAKNYLNRITDNTMKMDNLITEILTLSKLSQTEVKYQDDINLSEIVQKELNQLNEIEKRKKVKFDIKQNIKCKCDPNLVQIIIANLVGNAWKYTPNTKNAKFEFGTKNINDESVYYLKDNGVGFNMTFANKLFEPFQRLHDGTQFEGTGIGLATVKRIINLHHGKIWAESEVDKGTTFYFTLDALAH